MRGSSKIQAVHLAVVPALAVTLASERSVDAEDSIQFMLPEFIRVRVALLLGIELILKVEVFVLMLTPLDVVRRLAEEPLLVLMSVFSLIILILLARMFFSRGRIARIDVVKPLEMITEDKGLTLLDETTVTPEIYPVLVNGEVDIGTRVLLKTAEASTEIRPLLSSEEPDKCEYCSIFKDLSTIVCPNCGKPLNLPRAHEK